MSDETVARRILQAAAASGSRHVFGLPGVHNLAFWREQGDDLPEIVGVRHEQAAVYAADGLARATGRVGFALTTTGPGAGNAVGAFGEAAASGSPVVLVATEISTALRRPGVLRGVLHESRDQSAMFASLAKGTFTPLDPVSAVHAIEDAVELACTSPRGPVYVGIPTDVLVAHGPPVRLREPKRLQPNPREVKALRVALDMAEDIVIWVGGGAVQAGACAEIAALADLLDAPVVTTYGARGCIPPDHPQLVGLPPHEPEVAELIARSDVLLAVGTDFDGMMTRHWTMPMARQLASINCSSADMAKSYEPDVAVLADAKLALRALLDSGLRERPRRSKAGATLGQQVRARLASEPRTSDAMSLLASVESVLDPRTTVINDMCIPGYWSGGYAQVLHGRQQQYPLGWGTLGYALPASIGAATLSDARVLAICGDGGFMFAIGELATLVQEQLPVVIVLVDDGGYGMLRFDQDHAGHENRGVDLVRPDFVQLAQSFGIPVTVVSDPGQPLADALRTAQPDTGPHLILLEHSFYPPRTSSARWND